MGHEMFKGEVLETTVQKSRLRDSEIRKSESQGQGKGSGSPCEEPGKKDEGHRDHWLAWESGAGDGSRGRVGARLTCSCGAAGAAGQIASSQSGPPSPPAPVGCIAPPVSLSPGRPSGVPRLFHGVRPPHSAGQASHRLLTQTAALTTLPGTWDQWIVR